jgi:nicotinamidase-related amidase
MDALTVRPESTALVVVDVQDRLVPAMPEADARRMVACVALLAETARLLGVRVFATEQYPKGLGRTVEPLRQHFERHDPAPLVATKTVFSAADPAEIVRGLATSGARSVVVVGMEAHVCVFQTARDLRARGYFVHVPFDAVASRDPACRTTALALLAQHDVSVTTTETLVFDLLHDSENPHFKALSKLVRDLPIGR